MKKLKNIVFILIVMMFISIINVDAAGVSIKSIKLIDSNGSAAELSDPVPNGLDIKFDLSFSNVGDTATYEVVLNNTTNKEYSLIQGPPGTGKTFVIAIIAYILLCCDNKVIISSSNHLAINNVLCKIHKSIASICDLNPSEYKKESIEDEKRKIVNTLNLRVFKIGKSFQTEGLNYKFKDEDVGVCNLPNPNIGFFLKDHEGWIIGTTPNALYQRASGLEADVVILDENMPGLSGLECLLEIKKENPSLPVIMITKSEEEDIMEQAIGHKISDYLIKPVNPLQILMSLKKVVNSQEIIMEKTTVNYRAEFMRISNEISDKLSSDMDKIVVKG